MCKKCKSDDCIGFYLLHPKEFHKIQSLKDKHLNENPDSEFELITSPSSGETILQFKELHVIEKEPSDQTTP